MPSPMRGEIVFEHVWFAYDAEITNLWAQPVLKSGSMNSRARAATQCMIALATS